MTAPLHPPRRVLVIAMRYLGDVLLATPLVHAVRQRYPGCQIDMLVFDGTRGILEGNPDIHEVITIPERPDFATIKSTIRRLWRRYDIALITQPGDKPHLFGWVAAPQRYGFVPEKKGQAWWKRLSVRSALVSDQSLHRVVEGERLAAIMNLGSARTVVPPTAQSSSETLDSSALLTPGQPLRFDALRPYVVIHPSPRWRYKQWHQAGWQTLLDMLAQRGLQIVVSGGPGNAETQYIDGILADLPAATQDAITRAQGRLSLAEMADLLRRASLYVGPDTATTHLAAACGTPTLALYGPTDPRLWGPWPALGLDRPWEKSAHSQIRGNVMLLQHPLRDCVPCQQEGCERHRTSHSDCLDHMPTHAVVQAAQALLEPQRIIPILDSCRDSHLHPHPDRP